MDKKLQDAPTKVGNPSRGDKEEMAFTEGRYQEQKTQRGLTDGSWRIYQKMIDAAFTSYSDGRSSSVVPLATALIELGVAEELAVPINYKFSAENEQFESQKDTLEEVWKSLFRKNNYGWEELKEAYDCWGIGTSVQYLHFDRSVQKQNNATMDGLYDLSFNTQYLVKNDILADRFDYRNFYPDNRGYDFDEDIDCTAVQIMSYEEFQGLRNNPVWQNIEFVTPMSYLDGNLVNPSKEEKGMNGKFVQLKHYWNWQKDMYRIVANGQQIVRKSPVMTYRRGEKCLPFVMRQLGYKSNSKYGRGICELAMSFQSQINNYNEMLMDGVRRSSMEVLAVGSGLTLKNNKFQWGNRFLEFDGDINRLKQLSGTPPPQALFNGLDRIYTDVAVYTGLDVRNIIGDHTPTKFQAELQRESSLKRVKTWLKNRDMAYERKSDILQDLIQRYFWIDKSRRLVDTLENYKTETPEIEIDGKKLVGKKFQKTKQGDKYSLKVSQEMLKGELYVDVFTNDYASTSNAIHRENVLGFMQALPGVMEAYQAAKMSGVDMEGILPPADTIKELAENFDIDVKPKTMNKELKKQAEEAKNKLTALAQTQGVNMPQEQAPEGMPPQGMLPAPPLPPQ